MSICDFCSLFTCVVVRVPRYQTCKIPKLFCDTHKNPSDNYAAFGEGSLTHRTLKNHLASKLNTPYTTFDINGKLGERLDDEVEYIIKRCNAGKEDKDGCVHPAKENTGAFDFDIGSIGIGLLLLFVALLGWKKRVCHRGSSSNKPHLAKRLAKKQN